MYRPNKWLMFRVESDDPHYRIFGTWSGGYLDGDSWRLNSGIKHVRVDDNLFHFEGHSGSVYQCNRSSYGSTAYGVGVITTFPDKMQLLTEREAFDVISEMLEG